MDQESLVFAQPCQPIEEIQLSSTRSQADRLDEIELQVTENQSQNGLTQQRFDQLETQIAMLLERLDQINLSSNVNLSGPGFGDKPFITADAREKLDQEQLVDRLHDEEIVPHDATEELTNRQTIGENDENQSLSLAESLDDGRNEEFMPFDWESKDGDDSVANREVEVEVEIANTQLQSDELTSDGLDSRFTQMERAMEEDYVQSNAEPFELPTKQTANENEFESFENPTHGQDEESDSFADQTMTGASEPAESGLVDKFVDDLDSEDASEESVSLDSSWLPKTSPTVEENDENPSLSLARSLDDGTDEEVIRFDWESKNGDDADSVANRELEVEIVNTQSQWDELTADGPDFQSTQLERAMEEDYVQSDAASFELPTKHTANENEFESFKNLTHGQDEESDSFADQTMTGASEPAESGLMDSFVDDLDSEDASEESVSPESSLPNPFDWESKDGDDADSVANREVEVEVEIANLQLQRDELTSDGLDSQFTQMERAMEDDYVQSDAEPFELPMKQTANENEFESFENPNHGQDEESDSFADQTMTGASEPAESGMLDKFVGELDSEDASEESVSPESSSQPESSVSELLARMKAEGQWDGIPEGDGPEGDAPESELPAAIEPVDPAPVVGGEAEYDVGDYMSQLLNRMSGTDKPDPTASQFDDEEETPAEHAFVPVVNPLKAEEFKPVQQAQKIELGAMRDLANTSSRRAVHTSEKTRLKELGYVQIGIAACSFVMSAYFLLFYSQALMDLGFIAGVSCAAIASFLCYRFYSSGNYSEKNNPINNPNEIWNAIRNKATSLWSQASNRIISFLQKNRA